MGKFIDLTGQIFNKLTVIKRLKNNKQNRAMWLCKCSCNGENSEIIVTSTSLISGNTQSCGCLQKEKVSKIGKENKKYNTYDLTGEYGIGYTLKGEEFWFDLEDYDKIKDYCWRKYKNKYIETRFDNKIIFMHRLIMNFPEDMEIDHKYQRTWDNRKSELRIVNRPQNAMNRDKPNNNTSGVKGVHWDSINNQWVAQIGINNKRIYLGRYDNFDEAVKIRQEAEEKYFGEYNYKNIK